MKVSRRTKDILLTAVAVISGLLVVMGAGIGDYAKKHFWQDFWYASAWIGAIVFIGGWIFLKVQDKQSR
jgi:putative Mn2+ efflux pump MntP